MTVEILNRKRTGNGWVQYTGAVDGVKVGVRLPLQYVESVGDKEADAEVKDALHSEYCRLYKGDGGAAEELWGI